MSLGMFHSRQILRSLVQLEDWKTHFVAVIVEDGFKFPTESLLDEVLPSIDKWLSPNKSR